MDSKAFFVKDVRKTKQNDSINRVLSTGITLCQMRLLRTDTECSGDLRNPNHQNPFDFDSRP
jgi:hypothetical protein